MVKTLFILAHLLQIDGSQYKSQGKLVLESVKSGIKMGPTPSMVVGQMTLVQKFQQLTNQLR